MTSVFVAKSHLKSGLCLGWMEERKIKLLAFIALMVGMSVISCMVWAGKADQPVIKAKTSADGPNPRLEGGQKAGIGDAVPDGQRIESRGRVVQVLDRGKVSFLKLSPAARFQLVSFERLDLKEGDSVVVSGKVNTYQGKKEIIIDRVAQAD